MVCVPYEYSYADCGTMPTVADLYTPAEAGSEIDAA